MPTITLVTRIPAPPQACFDASLSVDAHLASMEQSGERIVGGVSAGSMRQGDTVTWRATHFGLPFRMTSQITEYTSPWRFVDEQVAGPFREWWHEHRFAEDGGGALMTDVVRFESPAGPVGHVVNRLFLTRYLTGLLEHRNRWLTDALSPEAPGSAGGRP